ncbi:class I SAM-dependent methyltransferase [Proteiniphilum sp.]|uniref:class I SAM-dependent methyltransferase n=1 Tax=Proteiniphilum sp. TaxID=1926877 RepID=UPI002B1FBDD1|nr:class I SAM-dependent methyltransferase [Proteiniphilum sp.]MEA4917010.1 class I SAM-dependent methyltransferase [Proteiniphilum sp.]
MSTIAITFCPICGSNDLQKVFDTVDHFSSQEMFPVCECLHCGFRFTNNFPSEETIGRYYDSPDYISHSDSDKGVINRLYHYFRKQMLRKKVKLVATHTTGDPIRLLDIGCGTGYFLQAAKEEGWSVTGIEKDEKTRKSATIRSGVTVKDENALWETESASFDAVTLWHVLEHLEKLNETIHKIEEIITPEGIVVIALPNCHSYDAGFYKEHWAAYDIPRHLWHFSPETVEKLLAKHHLQVVKKVRMPLDAFYISLLSEKYRRSNLLTKYIRAFVIGVTGFLRSLTDPGQSSSIIYIAKKYK